MVRDSVVKGRSEEQAVDTAPFCVNSYKFARRVHKPNDTFVVLLQEVSSIGLLLHRLTLAD